MGRVTITRQDNGESLEIDIVSDANLTRSWAITSHPVERGAAITDHTQPQPASLNLSGTITGIDINNLGQSSAAKFDAVNNWLISSYSVLWDVVIPDKPGLLNCLISNLQLSMQQDDLISIGLDLNEVVIVDSRSTTSIIAVKTGGAYKQKIPVGPPPAKSEPDLSQSFEDGAQTTEPAKQPESFLYGIVNLGST